MKLLRSPKFFLLIILAIGFFLRVYKPLEFFMYSHDQDLTGWIIKDILVNKHLRLIGQLTTSPGIFIGPLYYYLQIPFYLITRMDPKGAIVLITIFGVASIFSFYWVFSRIFNKRVGLIAAFIYSFSLYIVFIDREVVPTTPVMLWSVWFFYGIYLLLKGKSKGYLLLGLLVGLIWNLNLGLAILVPLIPIAQFLSKKKLNFKHIFLGGLVFVLTMSPFFVFEARHNFQQTKAIILSVNGGNPALPGVGKGYKKLDRVLQLVHKNTTSLAWDSVLPINQNLTFYALFLVFLFLAYKGIIPRAMSLVMLLWQILYIGFFTFNPINVSEYYLNGMNVVWISILALGISRLIDNKKLAGAGVFVLGVFTSLNIYGYVNRPINESGYLERKALVAFIDEDAKKHGYPCVAVSYMTDPGNNLGYRYLFWLRGMHVNLPKSEAPVYTIVFPHTRANRLDKTFGALGLVLPDYKKYTDKGIKASCEGPNANVSEPMFGYTE